MPIRLRSVAGLVFAASIALGLHDASANTWPPAAGSDMSDPSNWPSDPSYTTDWNLWSWIPKQISGAMPYLGADLALGASGMSVDRAWQHTIGRPDVRIAICDSGIEWDNADLVNKAYLNAAELGGSKQPHHADGTTCAALSPASLGYDCDGDGVFTVADYRDDPALSKPVAMASCPGGMTIAGDKNANCILDPGDLITLYSDHVDDDANGYTDDISGWDFFKNDNDPYDDTRYGHGSGEARDSTAEGNNAMGDIGVCPACRFLMLRAGDSFIADSNDFAKGVVYAADNGVKVLQEALGTVDQTAFSRAAIDYAYAKGMIVVASMADENSRHHNMPGVTNHTLPVHAITNNSTILQFTGGQVTTDATTFIAFNTCSNYGGQNMLSVSGTACSSEATGKASGAAGLIHSEALNKGLTLSPEEVMQLMKMNADLIDVPQSTSPENTGQFYESLPYFSQRFGYGRPNLEKTLEAVDQGLIPPEVDLTSPAWFEVIYADQVSAPVPVTGRIAASRAQSYDYTVEWAPGVEPSDAQFVPLVPWVRNVPASTATGGASAPIATLAPGQMNTAHTPDPDSLHHENDRTVTVRVRAVAHYASGDVQGQARRSVAIVNALPNPAIPKDAGPDAESDAGKEVYTSNGLDPDLVKGFPMPMGASVETSPKLADIDGDGVSDVVAAASDGSVHVFSLRSGAPVEVSGFPFHTSPLDGLNAQLGGIPGVPSYLSAPAYVAGSKGGGVDPSMARESIVATPAVGDIDGDGLPEIVVSTWAGTVYAVNRHGQLLAGWPKRLPLVPSCSLDPAAPTPPPCMDTTHKWARGAGASPVLVDFDHDGKLEVVQAAFDGNIYVWHGDGSALPGWPVPIHSTKATTWNRVLSTPALADFNGDGIPDLATGSNEQEGPGGGAGSAFLVDGRGTLTPGGSPYLPGWPVILTSVYLLPIVGEGVSASPAIGDFTNSGHPQVLLQGNGSPPFVFGANPGTQAGFADPSGLLPVYERDSGTQIGFDSTSIFGEGSAAFRPDTMFPLFSHPSIGDLDEDGVADVVMAGGSLSLAAAQAGGSSARPSQQLLSMWSGASGHMTYGSPVPLEDYTFLVNETIADVSGDGYPEVLLGTGGYFVRAVDACGCEAPSWPKFTGGWLIATPAIGDVDGDHKLEVVVGTRDGYLFAWHTDGTDRGVVQWESFHHDNQNTGNYLQKLDQGVLRTTTKPQVCATTCASAPAAETSSTFKAGGCGCRVAAPRDRWSDLASFGAGLGVLALALRRRRRGSATDA